ncbi:GerAB/ArcD/ProY family transporter [Paenibacillus radicis (ex Xue et al. 2023)]|uniref:Spore germination protein n=1 Tax=Paenibacillus radicis (ex Xue et al. 2023) TaxID=2972489 RepID=A0ABT1YUN8_9BACL|nr:spore germination protein [Paenibacillus radicis (ex Xue et al. 2023)]MCR8636464.1 spore germination protein [Paenibacillus radicis (ex Xue et al. 2023)]
MIVEENKITPGQLFFTVIQTQIGVGVLSLPSRVEAVAKGDAWISVLLTGLLAQLFIVIMWDLARKFPEFTIFDYLHLLLGKVLGKIIHFLLAAFFVFESSLILVLFTDVIRDWMFTETPRWVILLLTVIVCAYLVQDSFLTIARFFVLVSGLIFVLILIAAYAYTQVDFLYILPIGQAGLFNIVKGMREAMNSIYGFEIILVCYPFVEGGSMGKLKAVLFANVFSTLLYTFMVFTCLVVFTQLELKIIPQPVLYMIKALSFSIIERPDLYFLSIWVIVVATSAMAYLFMAVKGVSRLFGQEQHSKAVPYVTIVVLIIALIPQDQAMISALLKMTSYLSYIFIFGLPILLLSIHYLTKKIRKRRALA